MSVTKTKVKVNFFDTDAMAVVHHANYLRWFEMGRVEFLRSVGITLQGLIDDGFVFPITEVKCKYIASAKFDDIVIIETKPVALTPVKMAFEYQVIREIDGSLLATGFTQNVFTRIDTGKITKLPDLYYKKLKGLDK